MTARNLAFLAGAVALSLLAAWWRWPDSAHAIATIRKGGGSVRHGIDLRPGPSTYRLIATATVAPPWRGDARITVEGDPPLAWKAALDGPVVDLGVHPFPRLEGDVIRGLEPRERIALWVTLAAPDVDPACGMACGPGALREGGRCFCSAACREAFRANAAARPAGPSGPYRLALRDAATGAPLMAVPIAFGGGEGSGHAHH